jgi:hypothetical protein
MSTCMRMLADSLIAHLWVTAPQKADLLLVRLRTCLCAFKTERLCIGSGW